MNSWPKIRFLPDKKGSYEALKRAERTVLFYLINYSKNETQFFQFRQF